MKKIIMTLVLIFGLSVNGLCDEWLACDPQSDAANYAVIFNSDPEVIVPYQLNIAGTDVLLWNITGIDTAHFEIWAINDQERRSDFDPIVEGDQPVPFDLKAKPSPSSEYRIVQE